MNTIKNADLAYDKFVAAAQLSGLSPVDAERRALRVDRKFLPAFVIAQTPRCGDWSTPITAEYWDWLRSQVEQGEAERGRESDPEADA